MHIVGDVTGEAGQWTDYPEAGVVIATTTTGGILALQTSEVDNKEKFSLVKVKVGSIAGANKVNQSMNLRG